MNIILCALNAKFIHSSLALRCLMSNLREYPEDISVKEFTINHSTDFILSELYRLKPDIIGFSCYIWNIGMIKEIVSSLKKVRPDIKIILGGPEVSYDYDGLFDYGVDYIVVGEGEKTLKELIEHLLFNRSNLEIIKSIAYKHGGNMIFTGERAALDLDELPFAYLNGFDEFADRIIYYESSRGCPFNCQYCLSSAEKGLRFLSEKRIKNELDIFLKAGLRQVKFVDRTFNCNKKHSLSIWKHIIENDNGITNFHFEIAADLLDEEMMEVLKQARPGQIQFETGVQSTNLSTLETIKRKTNLTKLFSNVQKIKDSGNINMHLDLIAGLPGEDYESFKQSFNDVCRYYPEQLQLGFLKLLKGSGLRKNAERYGLVYRDDAPYEVLYTDDISFEEMLDLKDTEEMVEIYYNSNKFIYSIRFIIESFRNGFEFFSLLSEYWREKEYHLRQHNKIKIYTILYEFCLENLNGSIGIIKDLLKFDMFNCDNIKSLPYWLEAEQSNRKQDRIKDIFSASGYIYNLLPHYAAYSVKQISRMCAVQFFKYDITEWIRSGYKNIGEKEICILFDYKSASDLPGLASYRSGYRIIAD